MTTTARTHIDYAASVGLDPKRLPRHVAVIMDGNGRWARAQGQSRSEGHRAGAQAARQVITESARLGLDALTLYSFSIENWKRPADEINALMELCLEYLTHERDTLLNNNIRFRHIGRRDELPATVRRMIDETERVTSDATGLTVVMAMNYGARAELTDAMRAIAEQIASGAVSPGQITEQTISDHLYTSDLPDPDLLIRTAGEWRVSNYLLWQISYAELYVTDVLWPDFHEQALREALRDFAGRERRFGGVVDESTTA